MGSMEELPVIDPQQLDEFKLEVEEELSMNRRNCRLCWRRQRHQSRRMGKRKREKPKEKGKTGAGIESWRKFGNSLDAPDRQGVRLVSVFALKLKQCR